MHPFQFAYRKNTSVDDAILQVLNSIYSHLEKPGTCIRLMFYDFSSAFNTTQPHLTLRIFFNHECPGIHHNVNFRLSYKPSTVCQSAVRPQILESPATSCFIIFYIGRHLHQYGSATGDRFVTIFVFSVYDRL